MSDFLTAFSDAFSLVMENPLFRIPLIFLVCMSCFFAICRMFCSLLDYSGSDVFSDLFVIVGRWFKKAIVPLVIRFLIWTKIIVQEDQ